MRDSRTKRRAGPNHILTRIVATRWFRFVGPRVIPHLHRSLRWLTRGRFVPGAGLVLTTTGARTGKVRTTPLEAILDGADFIVVGSNFARETHPAWTSNLLANPEASVAWRGRTTRVSATLLEGVERAEAWAKALDHFAGWETYTDLTVREFRLFRLSPTHPVG